MGGHCPGDKMRLCGQLTRRKQISVFRLSNPSVNSLYKHFYEFEFAKWLYNNLSLKVHLICWKIGSLYHTIYPQGAVLLSEHIRPAAFLWSGPVPPDCLIERLGFRGSYWPRETVMSGIWTQVLTIASPALYPLTYLAISMTDWGIEWLTEELADGVGDTYRWMTPLSCR